MVELKSLSIVTLNGINYPTWKVQCRIALMKDSLWGIVSRTETSPQEDYAEKVWFVAREGTVLLY